MDPPPLLRNDHDPARDFLELLLEECAELAWRSGRGKEFILLLEALRMMRGLDHEPDDLNRYLTTVCLMRGYPGYLEAVVLCFDRLLVDDICSDHLLVTLGEWIRIRVRPHRYRLGDAWRRFFWASRYALATRKAR